jgi:hypothetical protein
VGTWLRQLLGAVLALAGAIWLLQGVGVLRGSFMTGSTLWAVIGAGCLVGGGGLLWWGLRSSR